MGRHILESALPEHLHRGRSSRHPSLASCFICNGITVVRKKCSEASPLEVWVDHCSLSICPDIRDRFTWRLERRFLTIIGMRLISVLARKAQRLNEYRKRFHVYTLDFWRHVMWVDNCQLFLLQGTSNPRKLEGGPSHKLPITQLAFHSLMIKWWDQSYPVDSSVIV